MLTLIWLSVWTINIYLSLQKKNSKYIAVLSFIFLIILVCGNTLSADYWNYRNMYETGNLSSFDIGYQIVGYLCMYFKMHYNMFVTVLVVPCYLTLFYIANKVKANIHMFFGLYFSFLVFYDINQIRNFIVATLLTLAIFFLYQKRNIPFLITISCAALFHSIALFYLPLIFIDKLQKNKRLIIYLGIYSILSIFLFKIVISQSDIIGRIIQLFSNNEEVIMYGISQINFGFLIPVFYFLFNVIFVIISKKILIRINKYDKYSRFIDICINTLVLSMIFLPLLTINLTFDRVFRNFSFVYYFLAGITMNELLIEKIKNKKIIIYFFSFLVAFSFVWTFGTIYRYNGSMIPVEHEKILNNNLFF